MLRTILTCLSIVAFIGNNRAQNSNAAIQLLLQLDSISKSESVSKHFAAIYLETTVGAVTYFSNMEPRVQSLMERLETRFASYFLNSANAYRDQQQVPEVWQAYYSDTTASPLRYVLYGINAHINGDIWQALTAEFTPAEIIEIKPYYFTYQKELLKNYKDYYEDALASNQKMRLLHTVSFGLDKMYGKVVLKRWRKRQMKLAELYYSDPEAFEKKKVQVIRKMDKLNQLIGKNI